MFRSAAERFALDVHKKPSPRKQGPFEVIYIDDNTLYIIQDELENTISIHKATLSLTSKHHCDEDQTKKEERANEEEP